MDALLHAALNNAAWAAALALAAAVAARIWRRYPAVVHALWLMVLLKLVMPSLVHLSLHRGDGLPRIHAEPAEPPDVSRPIAAVSPPVDIDAEITELSTIIPSQPDAMRTVEIPHQEPIATASVSWPWTQVILAVWLIGTAAWSLAVGLGAVRFRRLIRSARPAPPELSERLGQVALRLGLRRAPAAWLLPARVPPMLWVPLVGPPRLVLPEELWDRLDTAQRDAVLAHELAHLKRRDHWVRRLEAAVLGLYWWDPVAWWARREVERSEEECCDAWVVWALPQAADAYAEALVATAAYLSGFRQPLPLGASGVGSLISLKRRLNMIVCDSMTASVVRTAPRALLVLGVLTLPFLPGLAAGKPSGESAQAGMAEPSPRERAFAADPAEAPPTDMVEEPRPAPTFQDQGATSTKPPVKVKVFQPISREVGEFVDLAEPAHLSSPRVELRTRVRGRIDRVNCRPGEAVKKGQVLFEIDASSYKVLLDKAQAGVRQAEARRKRWQSDWERAKDLKERNAISQEEVNRVESEYEEAQASLQAAEADRDLAKLNLDATRVVSPIDGVMSKVIAQPGDAVLGDSFNLATIVSLDPLFMDFYIGEDVARFLDRSPGGGKLKAGVNPEIPILIGVRDEVGFPHRGLVDFVDPEIQPVAEAAVHLRARIPNPDRSLASGLKARVRLVTNARHKALLIPDRVAKFFGVPPYVVPPYVYVVNGQDVVEKRLVRVGLRYDDLREIEDGLKSDDWVVMYPGIIGEAQKVVPDRMKPPGSGEPAGEDAPPPPEKKKEGRPAAAKVRVSRPLRREVNDYLIFTGHMEPAMSVEFRPRVDGRLLKVNCESGQMVKKNDVLFEIDPRVYQAELDKVKAEVEPAQARVTRSKAQRDRASRHLKRQEIGQNEFDLAALECQQAEAALQEMQKARDLALLQLEYTRVKAPIDGMIVGPVVEAGKLVVADKTPLGKMISIDKMYVYFDVDQQTVLKVYRLKRDGKLAGGAEGAGLTAHVGLPDEPGFPREGQVNFEGVPIDPATGTARWRVTIPNRDRFLMPGLFAQVRLALGKPHKALLVPEAAVATDQGQKFVFVVTDQNVAQRRTVKLGGPHDGFREVTQGLTADEWVVIDRLQRIRSGMEIVPERVSKPPGSSP